MAEASTISKKCIFCFWKCYREVGYTVELKKYAYEEGILNMTPRYQQDLFRTPVLLNIPSSKMKA